MFVSNTGILSINPHLPQIDVEDENALYQDEKSSCSSSVSKVAFEQFSEIAAHKNPCPVSQKPEITPSFSPRVITPRTNTGNDVEKEEALEELDQLCEQLASGVSKDASEWAEEIREGSVERLVPPGTIFGLTDGGDLVHPVSQVLLFTLDEESPMESSEAKKDAMEPSFFGVLPVSCASEVAQHPGIPVLACEEIPSNDNFTL